MTFIYRIFLSLMICNNLVNAPFTYTAQIVKNDFQPSEDPFASFSNIENLLHCAAVCVKKSCESYAYKEPVCNIYSDHYSLKSLKSTPGFKYYKVKIPLKVYHHEQMTWVQAKQLCEDHDRRLVVIHDEQKYRNVIQEMGKGKSTGKFWIGLESVDRKGNFRWVDGVEIYVEDVNVESKNPFYTWDPKKTIDYHNYEKVHICILGSNFGETSFKWADELEDTKFSSSICESFE